MNVTRLNKKFKADPERVILRPLGVSNQRTKNVISKILLLNQKEAKAQLDEVINSFESRHKDFEKKLLRNYKNVEKFAIDKKLTKTQKYLIGSYFSMEYSIEAAALFNPSIVAHPNQCRLRSDELRFVMSLRATGEGHISSIRFKEGIINSKSKLSFNKETRYCSLPEIEKNVFTKPEQTKRYKFYSKLESEGKNRNSNPITYEDYSKSNYAVKFAKDIPLDERVLFPHSPSESKGMEDVRFVRFINDDGSAVYYGTYSAYSGKIVRTQLIKTIDFQHFSICTLFGSGINDKGMALFPRKINGQYYITSRQDGENLYLMNSSDINHWSHTRKIMVPENSWSFVQLGNCGSPLETDEGWLLIIHGVGPIRKYVISAILLDKKNPSKVIGKLKQPLISPNESEREGYVPNVVYSCGSVLHNNKVIIPYAMSDSYCGFAEKNVKELLNEMQ
ncbi:MAG: glycoside hydrolase family 130 protein [Bacteroidota bacterium]|nr:glycoside hydrolase family 130 protein [Bacteroidota bacterium]